jgi:hypothetical protein
LVLVSGGFDLGAALARRAGNADARGPAIRKKMSSSGEIRIEASAKFCA